MAFVHDQDMIQTLPANAAQKALADCIGPRSRDGSSEDVDATRCRDARQLGAVLAVVISKKETRSLVKRGGFTQVLGDPLIGWMPGHSDMDHCARAEFTNEERKERSKPEIGDLEDVAGPDLVRVIVHEGGPRLAMVLRWSSLAHIRLYRALAYLDAQLQ